MHLLRTSLTVLLAIALAACGGNDDDPAPAPTPVTVTLVATTPSIQVSQFGQFQATVEGSLDKRVTYSVEGGPPNGDITTGGVYIAPPVVMSPLGGPPSTL